MSVWVSIASTDHPRSRGVYLKLARKKWGRGDHPRSRGVYLLVYRKAAAEAGSSPLARGLL